MCVAALWVALPAVLGASLNPPHDAAAVDSDTLISSYTRTSPQSLHEERTEPATGITREQSDAARRPLAEEHAVCDFIATFPSGRALCFWIQW